MEPLTTGFVPQRVVNFYNARDKLHPGTCKLTSPSVEVFPAAVLFADMSGFTPLTERLSLEGRQGAEKITLHLNDYFGKMIGCIEKHGGDVIKFAGDALLCCFAPSKPDGGLKPKSKHFESPDDKSNGTSNTSSGLAEAVARAVKCAIELHSKYNGYEPLPDITLYLHSGISCGMVCGAHLGGVNGRWEYVLDGNPIGQLDDACKQAKNGDFVLTPQAWALVSKDKEGTVLENGCVRVHYNKDKKKSAKPKPVETTEHIKPPGTPEPASPGPRGRRLSAEHAIKTRERAAPLTLFEIPVKMDHTLQRGVAPLSLRAFGAKTRSSDLGLSGATTPLRRSSEPSCVLDSLRSSDDVLDSHQHTQTHMSTHHTATHSSTHKHKLRSTLKDDEDFDTSNLDVPSHLARPHSSLARLGTKPASLVVSPLKDDEDLDTSILDVPLHLARPHSGLARPETKPASLSVPTTLRPQIHSKSLPCSPQVRTRPMPPMPPIADSSQSLPKFSPCYGMRRVSDHRLTGTLGRHGLSPERTILPEIVQASNNTAVPTKAPLDLFPRSHSPYLNFSSEDKLSSKTHTAPSNSYEEDEHENRDVFEVEERMVVSVSRTSNEVAPKPKRKNGSTSPKLRKETIGAPAPKPSDSVIDALYSYVPQNVLPWLVKGQGRWLSEIRALTILFVSIPSQVFELDAYEAHTYNFKSSTEVTEVGPDPELADDQPAYHKSVLVLQRVATTAMKICAHNEGNVRQLITDDKGTVMILVFGLGQSDGKVPSAVRGLRAALQIGNDLEDIEVSVKIGVTTGSVFCGAVGSSHRCEYAMVGDKVNTSARLMCAVPEARGIVCDQDTHQLALGHFAIGASLQNVMMKFMPMAPMKLKGKKELQRVYKVSLKGNALPLSGAHFLTRVNRMLLVGRETELAAIQTRLDELSRGTVPRNVKWTSKGRLDLACLPMDLPTQHGVIVVEGQSGCGKTVLLSGSVRRANVQRLNVLVAMGSNEEKQGLGGHFRSVVFDLVLLIAEQLVYTEQLLDGSQPPVAILSGSPKERCSVRDIPTITKTFSQMCDSPKAKTRVSEAFSPTSFDDRESRISVFHDYEEVLSQSIKLVSEKLPFQIASTLHVLSHVCPALSFPALDNAMSSVEPEFTGKLRSTERLVKSAGLIVEVRNLIVSLFRIMIGLNQRPIYLVLENWHRADVLSKIILEDLLGHVQHLLVALSSPPVPADDPDAPAAAQLYRSLCSSPTTLYIQLTPFDREKIQELACCVWNQHAEMHKEKEIKRVAPDLVDVVLARSRGLPVFVKGLIDRLIDLKDVLVIVNDKGELRFNAADNTEHEVVAMEKLMTFIPSSMEEIVNARTASLDPDVQMVLKVASVAGDGASHMLLEDVVLQLLPGRDVNAGELIQVLVDSALLVRLRSSDQYDEKQMSVPPLVEGTDGFEAGYMFQNSFMRNVVYDRLAFADRCMIHRLVALWHTSHYTGDTHVLSNVALHWAKVCELETDPKIKGEAWDQAAKYLKNLACRAEQLDVHDEAVNSLDRALELCGDLPTNERKVRQRGELGLLTKYCRTQSGGQKDIKGLLQPKQAAKLASRWSRMVTLGTAIDSANVSRILEVFITVQRRWQLKAASINYLTRQEESARAADSMTQCLEALAQMLRGRASVASAAASAFGAGSGGGSGGGMNLAAFAGAAAAKQDLDNVEQEGTEVVVHAFLLQGNYEQALAKCNQLTESLRAREGAPSIPAHLLAWQALLMVCQGDEKGVPTLRTALDQARVDSESAAAERLGRGIVTVVLCAAVVGRLVSESIWKTLFGKVLLLARCFAAVAAFNDMLGWAGTRPESVTRSSNPLSRTRPKSADNTQKSSFQVVQPRSVRRKSSATSTGSKSPSSDSSRSTSPSIPPLSLVVSPPTSSFLENLITLLAIGGQQNSKTPLQKKKLTRPVSPMPPPAVSLSLPDSKAALHDLLRAFDDVLEIRTKLTLPHFDVLCFLMCACCLQHSSKSFTAAGAKIVQSWLSTMTQIEDKEEDEEGPSSSQDSGGRHSSMSARGSEEARPFTFFQSEAYHFKALFATQHPPTQADSAHAHVARFDLERAIDITRACKMPFLQFRVLFTMCNSMVNGSVESLGDSTLTMFEEIIGELTGRWSADGEDGDTRGLVSLEEAESTAKAFRTRLTALKKPGNTSGRIISFDSLILVNPPTGGQKRSSRRVR